MYKYNDAPPTLDISEHTHQFGGGHVNREGGETMRKNVVK